MENILVVEDDISLSRGIVYALQKEGWIVDSVQTAEAGFTRWQEGQYHLVLLDVMLPDGDGFDLCQRIRVHSDIPIIFLTACDEEVSVIQGLDLGGDDYITKPFRVRELVSRIRAILRRTRTQVGVSNSYSSINSGKISLMPFDQRVFCNGEEIFLTPSEFKLITIFMNNPLQVLSREQLLAKLWDAQGKFVDDNTLSVYIRRLREKIEADPQSPEYIYTVRGVGYKWNQRSHSDV